VYFGAAKIGSIFGSAKLPLCWHWTHEESEITRTFSMHNAELLSLQSTRGSK